MDKDLIAFKTWLKNLGLEINDGTDDEALKKLLPPQRRDMWRNIEKHVLPEKEVELIKKSILLRKLQKRQKPLMTKVESVEDLANALKYEELMTKYTKIQKEIVDAKINNNKIKTNLNEKIKHKKILFENIKSKQNTSYLAKHIIEYYTKCIEQLKETANCCNHFSAEVNKGLTKTDYEDSLIKCFVEVDNAKQSGSMRDSLDVGQNLCNNLYKIVRDKSPIVLIKTFEENLTDKINKSNIFITEQNKFTEPKSGNENAVQNVIKKLVKIQLKLKSELSLALAEKDRMMAQLKETTVQERNEIINQYKLRYVLSTDQELLVFKENLKEAFKTVVTNSIDRTQIINVDEKTKLEGETFGMLDDFLEKAKLLTENIDQNKNIINEMMKEFVEKKSDFELKEITSANNNFAEIHSKKNIDDNLINEKIMFLKNHISSEVHNKKKLTIVSKPSVIKFQTLQEGKHYSEIVDVLAEVSPTFEQFNNITSDKNDVDEISQKENMHKSEFDNIMCELENSILDLNSSIEDCKLVAEVMSTIQPEK